MFKVEEGENEKFLQLKFYFFNFLDFYLKCLISAHNFWENWGYHMQSTTTMEWLDEP